MISWINKFIHEIMYITYIKINIFQIMDEIKMRSKSWNIGDYRTKI